MARAGQPRPTNQQRKKKGQPCTAMAERWRQRSGGSEVADRDKQVESRININKYASCTTLARYRRCRQDGNEYLNVLVSECLLELKLKCLSKTMGNKTLLNTYVCQAPSLQVSALASLAKQPQCAAIHGNHQAQVTKP